MNLGAFCDTYLSGFSSTVDCDRLFSFEVLDFDSFETLPFGADLGVLGLSIGIFDFELEQGEEEW